MPKPVDPEQLYATLLRWLPMAETAVLPVAPPEKAYTPLPAGELAAKLKGLAELLASGDIASAAMFSQLEAHLVHRFGAAVAPLKAAISDFDYEVANQLLAELVEAAPEIGGIA